MARRTNRLEWLNFKYFFCQWEISSLKRKHVIKPKLSCGYQFLVCARIGSGLSYKAEKNVSVDNNHWISFFKDYNSQNVCYYFASKSPTQSFISRVFIISCHTSLFLSHRYWLKLSRNTVVEWNYGFHFRHVEFRFLLGFIIPDLKKHLTITSKETVFRRGTKSKWSIKLKTAFRFVKHVGCSLDLSNTVLGRQTMINTRVNFFIYQIDKLTTTYSSDEFIH